MIKIQAYLEKQCRAYFIRKEEKKRIFFLSHIQISSISIFKHRFQCRQRKKGNLDIRKKYEMKKNVGTESRSGKFLQIKKKSFFI